MQSNVIEIYAIDPETGLLSKTDNDITGVDSPVCVKLIEN